VASNEERAPAALTPAPGKSPDALTPPPGNPRFPLFDGLRAVAALSVLLYHAGFYSRANEGATGLSPYLARLNVGVAVFFVISGFLLYRPLLAARASQDLRFAFATTPDAGSCGSSPPTGSR